MTIFDVERRALLCGAAAVGAGMTLTACGDDSTPAAAPSPAEAEATAIGNVSPPPPPPPSNGAEALNALGNAADVPVGGGVIYPGPKVVVTQPAQGTFKAFTAVCTHAGCLVSTVDKTSGAIVCPCHGSRFSVNDGSVMNGPATDPLEEQKVTVAGGSITLG